ncbi:uncharacterized protein LACBIDRAFT_301813 [Laccaria bicolor S238N-H82]|uniref:Predicted protein n=1 Tax=Laccaria bicolor (strain S238N-H82 / ATCC MYA-4686) TaxID=486041 RepID=B0CPC9_LACBS|nr:uncharacterized protein LACBIDRAFT_301813 [Laccaria bicolor S238N-H82]EDR15452.1 predicted protein [Laccaria bicolor S238N-H82]|eukprot:XP_001873660.1 predicted protein [Laccaria bicolor S238N-H82]
MKVDNGKDSVEVTWRGCHLVFESPVRSGFLMPRGVNRNRNRSAFSPEVKRPDRTAKRPQTAVFCGL